MLVLEGRPVELDAHLGRLAASLAALYDAGLPDGVTDAVLDRASDVDHGKLRLTVAPNGDGQLETRVSTTEVAHARVFPPPERGIALRSFIVAGGLGDHKWADRRLLERTAASSPNELTLLVDADGAVLEAARGSVFSAGEGWIATPPTDGRILPSIARGQAIEVARAAGVDAREERLTLDDLHRGDEVFIAGSVRGIEPVRSLDGLDLPLRGKISARIGVGLRRRWWRAPQGEPFAAVAGGRQGGPPSH